MIGVEYDHQAQISCRLSDASQVSSLSASNDKQQDECPYDLAGTLSLMMMLGWCGQGVLSVVVGAILTI